MKIIVDMMGGDNAPLAVLEGAAAAVKEYGVSLIGVGNEELVRKTAAEHNIPLEGIELVNCTETIDMCDEPARAIRPLTPQSGVRLSLGSPLFYEHH